MADSCLPLFPLLFPIYFFFFLFYLSMNHGIVLLPKFHNLFIGGLWKPLKDAQFASGMHGQIQQSIGLVVDVSVIGTSSRLFAIVDEYGGVMVWSSSRGSMQKGRQGTRQSVSSIDHVDIEGFGFNNEGCQLIMEHGLDQTLIYGIPPSPGGSNIGKVESIPRRHFLACHGNPTGIAVNAGVARNVHVIGHIGAFSQSPFEYGMGCAVDLAQCVTVGCFESSFRGQSRMFPGAHIEGGRTTYYLGNGFYEESALIRGLNN